MQIDQEEVGHVAKTFGKRYERWVNIGQSGVLRMDVSTLIRGVKHSLAADPDSSILDISFHFYADKSPQQTLVGGYCVLDKTFGKNPSLNILCENEKSEPVSFKEKPTFQLKKRFEGQSLNCGACRITTFLLTPDQLPAKLIATSEDQKMVREIAAFEYDRVDQIYDQLAQKVKVKDLNLDNIYVQFEALSEMNKNSEDGRLLAAVLGIIRYDFNGPYEADLLAKRVKMMKNTKSTGWANYLTYEKLLKSALFPKAFGSHGITSKFEDQEIPESFWSKLNELLEFLNDEFGPSFVESGTLLGLTREGRPLPHDDDIDIAIMMPATNELDAATQWMQIKRSLLGKGLLSEHLMQKTTKVPVIKALRIEGIPIDLFPAWVEDGKVFIYPHTFGELNVEDVLPLGRDLQTGVLIPANPEKMLAVNYGPDWVIPGAPYQPLLRMQQKKFQNFLSSEGLKYDKKRGYLWHI